MQTERFKPEATARETRNVGESISSYLRIVVDSQAQDDLQICPFPQVNGRVWGDVLNLFTRNLSTRVEKAKTNKELSNLLTSLVTRGVELVSGGVVSHHDVPDGFKRGLGIGGTWPEAPDSNFWDPRDRKAEAGIIREEILPSVLEIETLSSEVHVGRVLTMALPALLSWAEVQGDLQSSQDIVEATRRMLLAEQTGKFEVVAFGCEPYEYEWNPNTTTSHFRRSEFGSQNTLRSDAIHGSFRAVRRILEPLTLSGIKPNFHFFTSFGTSLELIQRQVMPDTINVYRQNPSQILQILSWWKELIENKGTNEFNESGIEFILHEMESDVVLPAMEELADVLTDCGMPIPSDRRQFIFNSEAWFENNLNSLNLIKFMQNHPNPMLLLEFLLNEDQWSRLHPEAYLNEEQRIVQSSLLSFFELHQYQRINSIINGADLSLGVEIDEELISKVRDLESQNGDLQTPLIWGRSPRYTKEGIAGGVAHRQPWFYA